MPQVFVAGSINMDLVAVSDALPRPGETVLGRDFARHPGGKGANQAVASAKLDATTRLVGKVGDDAFGAELSEFLRRQGVDTTRVTLAPVATGTALILVDAQGENCIVVVPGANDRLEPSDVAELPLSSRDVALTQCEIPPATIERFLRRAKQADAIGILNPAPARAEHAGLLPLADILLLNETELALFAGAPGIETESRRALELAERVRCRSEQIIVVTLGARGAVALCGSEQILLEGRRVVAVDTTGAGDTFAGALAASLADGAALRQALERANSAAAISVQRPGAAESSPSRTELDALAP
jgi:ribokinase